MFTLRHFSGVRVFRFNHIPHHTETVDAVFETWALNYAHQGQVYYSAEGGEERYFDGPVAFWTWPGPRWCYRPGPAGHWDHSFISWKDPRAEVWQQNRLHPLCPPSEAYRLITNPKDFRRRFARVQSLLSERELDDPEAIYELEGLLLQLHLQPKVTSPTTPLVGKVRALIAQVSEAPMRLWHFPEEVLRLGCTPVHFRRVWKQETEMTPVQFLHKARLKRAAALLRQQDYNIDEIAQQMGFETRGYFSRLFLREYKLSPRAYRQSFQSVE